MMTSATFESNPLPSHATKKNEDYINVFQDTTQDKKFTRILQILVGVYLLIAVVVPFIE